MRRARTSLPCAAVASAVRGTAILLVVAGAAGCSPRSREPGSSERASVLLITIDTLRADRLGCYGDAQARTPRIDALAAAGVVFEAAYTPVPITLPAHVSLMTGLLPPAHGVRGNGTFALGSDHPVLAEALRDRGYATAAFMGAFPLARRFGLDRGFDHYDDDVRPPAGVSYDFAERPAPAVVGAARRWLADRGQAVFLWVHLFDPHAPYAPPPPFAGPDPYRGEVAAVDAALAPLLADWDRRHGPSLIVLASDHGEAFGEHGERSHSLFVYDTTLRVPLILRGSGLASGRRSAPVSLADVAATILGYVQAKPVERRLPGRNLLAPDITPEPLYAETLAPRLDFGWSELRSWRDGRYKYIRAPRPELYDVQADPVEARDLAGAEPQRLAQMEAALAKALGATGERESRQRLDPEAAERLHALGYVQGPGGGGSGADPKDRLEVALRIAAAAGPFETQQQAARVYREIVALDPPNPLANFRLADALLRAGRAADALPHYRLVVAAGPRTAEAHVGLATALAELGRLDEAGRVLQEGLRIEPLSGQVHFNLGELARVHGQTREARERYSAALNDPVTRTRAQERLRVLR